MKKLNLTMATMAAVTLIGCGGGGSSSSSGGTSSDGTASDAQETQKVSYTLNGSNHPICNKPYSMSGIESNSERMSCLWLCGEYEGARPVAVSLRFEKVGGVWELADDSVSTASELCHN